MSLASMVGARTRPPPSARPLRLEFALAILTGLLLRCRPRIRHAAGSLRVTGAFRDVFVTKNTRWLTAFLIVIAVQSVGIFALTEVRGHRPEGVDVAARRRRRRLHLRLRDHQVAGGASDRHDYRAGEGLVGSWLALVTYAGFSAIMKTGLLSGVSHTAVRDDGALTDPGDARGLAGCSSSCSSPVWPSPRATT